MSPVFTLQVVVLSPRLRGLTQADFFLDEGAQLTSCGWLSCQTDVSQKENAPDLTFSIHETACMPGHLIRTGLGEVRGVKHGKRWIRARSSSVRPFCNIARETPGLPRRSPGCIPFPMPSAQTAVRGPSGRHTPIREGAAPQMQKRTCTAVPQTDKSKRGAPE